MEDCIFYFGSYDGFIYAIERSLNPATQCGDQSTPQDCGWRDQAGQSF